MKPDDYLIPAFSVYDSMWYIFAMRPTGMEKLKGPYRELQDVQSAIKLIATRLRRGWIP